MSESRRSWKGGGEAAAEQQREDECGKRHSRQMPATFGEDGAIASSAHSGSDDKSAGQQHRVLRDHHGQEMRPLITERAQQRQFPPALQHIPQQNRGKTDRSSSSPSPPSIWNVERYVFST